MNITEIPIDAGILTNLPESAAEGAKLVNVSMDAPTIEIVSAINTFVAKRPKPWFKKVDNWTDRALPLGTLWAIQIIRQFQWEWLNMIQHDYNDLKVMAVFNKERSLGIYPFHYVFGCFENEVYPTILLAFNMLLAEKIPPMQAGSYTNLMDGVRHIVPPK